MHTVDILARVVAVFPSSLVYLTLASIAIGSNTDSSVIATVVSLPTRINGNKDIPIICSKDSSFLSLTNSLTNTTSTCTTGCKSNYNDIKLKLATGHDAYQTVKGLFPV